MLTDKEINTPDNHLDSKGVENLTAKNLEIASVEGIYCLYFIELLDTNALAATDTVADEDDLISGSYDSFSIPGNYIQKDIHVDVYALAVARHEDIRQKAKKRLLDTAEKMVTKYNASKKIKCVQFSEGDAVTVRVPPQDRGPCDLSRVPRIISKASGEFYKIRTECGLLSRQFRSDELEKYDTVTAKSEINSEDLSVITLREAAKRFNSRKNEVSL